MQDRRLQEQFFNINFWIAQKNENWGNIKTDLSIKISLKFLNYFKKSLKICT